ncbi:MAG: hypothetical protein KDI43_18150 [Gammaproteobacteria bacterium]|nr:hypothetical protein [Gammaproteobacteria bacterium]MCP5442182.1 hypothetical protein [Chromatiaceae bacterium]MCP5444717.1 hypothetical protein [Chromatiaceae bacterium]
MEINIVHRTAPEKPAAKACAGPIKNTAGLEKEDTTMPSASAASGSAKQKK